MCDKDKWKYAVYKTIRNLLLIHFRKKRLELKIIYNKPLL